MLGTRDVTATIAVRDMERARYFYEETLGLKRLPTEEQDACCSGAGARRSWSTSHATPAPTRPRRSPGSSATTWRRRSRRSRPRASSSGGTICPGPPGKATSTSPTALGPPGSPTPTATSSRWSIGEPGGPRRPAGVDRPRRHRPSLPALLDGPDGPQPRAAVAERGPRAQQLPAAVDRGHLRLPGRRNRSITMGTLGDRIGRRRLLLIGAAAFGVASVDRGVLHQRRDADRHARAARSRRRDLGAVHPLPDPQHVPRPRAAHRRHRRVDLQLLGRGRDRAGARRASCWSSSGGGRCS